MSYSLGELADRFDLQLDQDESVTIEGVCGLKDNMPNHLSFVCSAKYVTSAVDSQIKAFITKRDLPIRGKINLYSEDPEDAIARVAELFVLTPMASKEPIHSTAVLGGNVSLGPNVRLGPYVVTGSNVTIGANTTILAATVILDHVTIGEDCIVYPNVTIREGCKLGNRVIVQPGAVIGGDGYGFLFREGKHKKIPQIGSVVIEDDVEIGANTTIDRGRFCCTRIGQGTKIDNLVQIGHNVKMGRHCLLVAQAGVAGSTTLGNHVTVGGQTGVNGHVDIVDNVTILGMSMVTKCIHKSGFWAGVPAKPAEVWRRSVAFLNRAVKKDWTTRKRAVVA